MAIVALSGTAAADVLQRIKFSQAPIIMVWNGAGAPQKGVEVTVQPMQTVAETVPFGGGILEPIEARLGLANIASGQSFRVASNVPFEIRAQVRFPASGQDAPFRLRIGEIGSNAQQVGGMDIQGLMLSDLRSPQVIYRSGQRTAAQPGNPSSQSIEFIADWAGAAGTEVKLTVFIP